MQGTLMHKNIDVALIEYQNGAICKLYEIINTKHMPIGTYSRGMSIALSEVYLRAWQRARAIPLDRLNFSMLLKNSGFDIFRLEALSHCMGLTDHYWVKTENEYFLWEDINFHRNGFKNSLLTLLGSGEFSKTPDYETNGCLPKAWVLFENVPTLIKDSPPWLPTASANEVIAAQIAELCGIEHAMYFPVQIEDHVFCGSPCFVGNDREEFVPVSAYLRTHRGPLIEKVKEIGIPDDFIHRMALLDLLLGNDDRHEGNFGYLIDSDTMEYTRPAPLFDSGFCLHHPDCDDYYFKPFFETRKETVNNLSLNTISVPDEDVLAEIVESVYTAFSMKDAISSAVKELHRNKRELESHRHN